MNGRPRVVGLDLSLTSTGMSDGETNQVVHTAAGQPLEARMDRLVRGVLSFVLMGDRGAGRISSAPNADLVVIEGSSFGSRGPGHEELAALRILVRHRMWRMGVPFALVPPTTLKKYTTGDGRAAKAQMVAAVDERHRAGLAGVKVRDGRYDMADALALAAMGYDYVGHPLPQHFPAPPPHRASLASVQWPEMVSDE